MKPHEKIRELREARGMSLQDVVNLIDPKPGKMTLSRLERGERKITMEWVRKIAGALNVPVAEILGDEESGYVTKEWLSTEMERRGLKRQDLATVLGVVPSVVSDLFAGRRRITPDDAKKVHAWLRENPTEQGTAPVHKLAATATIQLYQMVEVDGVLTRSSRPVGRASPFEAFEGFAVYMAGFDMSPRFEEGDILFIDTVRQPRRGEYVFVTATDGGVSVRRYEGRDGEGYTFSTLSPAGSDPVPADKVASVYFVRGSSAP